jgi:uncharacterized membrane protein YvbJ
MFCTQCGNQLSEDRPFCTKCGKKVNEPCVATTSSSPTKNNTSKEAFSKWWNENKQQIGMGLHMLIRRGGIW